ncbi:MAG TPA: PKD domain-containing protein [Solirubrobacterales bacterium]|nr:PKD domain-containing protein [Solirubrobacterales bacterium]
MSRRLLHLLAGLTLLGCVFSAGASAAARFYTPDYGSSTPEEIGGFDLGADGSLAPIPGSPFPAEKPPLGGLWDLAFTPDGTRAVTGFFFTGGVQGYRVPPSGIFELAGEAVPTASATGIAITPDGRFAYASTREFMSKPYEGIRRFSIGADGTLASLGPPAPLAGDADALAITPDGRFLFAARGIQIVRFAIGADGGLAPLGSTPAPGVFHLLASPAGGFLFAEVTGGLASYAIGPDGGLSKVGPTAPTREPGIQIPAVSPDGRYVYVPDYGANLIETVAIAADGTPALVGGGIPVDVPESVSVSPDGRFLVFYEAGAPDNTLGVAAIGPDGVPTVLPFSTPWNTGEPERIAFQPQPTPVASFKANPAAPGEPSQLDAGASARAARYDWSFGDGTTLLDGGPRPAHVYAGPGAYEVTLTVTDAAGCSTRHFYTGQSTVCPGGSAARTTTVLDTLPGLSRLKAAPRKFLPKVRGVKAGKAKLGTSFRYALTESATVRFKIERKLPGRLVKGKCRPQSKANSGKKKCPLLKLRGSRSQAGKAGANKLKWNGKLKGKPLPPGSYRATVVATDKAGGRSSARTVGFRVLPLPQEP